MESSEAGGCAVESRLQMSATTITVEEAMQMAIAQYQAGRLGESESVCRQILAHHDEHPDALLLLGLIGGRAGRLDAAIGLIQRAIAAAPGNAAAHHQLGKMLVAGGRPAEAVASFHRCLHLVPGQPEVLNDLGIAHGSAGQLEEAIETFRKCLHANPANPDALSNLGKALFEMGRLNEAIAACQECLRLQPAHLNARVILGTALLASGSVDEAILSFQQALELDPNHAEAHLNLGNCQKEQGLIEEAIRSYRRAVALRPDWPAAHSNLLLTLHYYEASDADSLHKEHRAWAHRHADPLKVLIRQHDNPPDPSRVLRIGYVSGDFREHPVARFLLPLMEHHDRKRFEVFCYADESKPDAFTERLRGFASQWRTITGAGDDRVAEIIRRDGIDILVDLASHTAHNRLLVFARKPAPVQVTYLAYCSTTGLDAIDYRMTDPFLDSAASTERVYSEQSEFLPKTYWCYLAPPFAPEVNALPAHGAGRLTFGCLNGFQKVSHSNLLLWGRILRAAPSARLLLHAHTGSHRQRILDLLAGESIAADRIEFAAKLPMGKYLELYHRIGLCLDSHPFGGGTTTCDALWMGVPVVTLAGATAVSRAGQSILSNVGIPELVAQTGDQYVAIATELAGAPARLAELRATLRGRMKRSPLMDAPRFARSMEAAYRGMWGRWCESRRRT